jgi:hypothetical protein
MRADKARCASGGLDQTFVYPVRGHFYPVRGHFAEGVTHAAMESAVGRARGHAHSRRHRRRFSPTCRGGSRVIQRPLQGSRRGADALVRPAGDRLGIAGAADRQRRARRDDLRRHRAGARAVQREDVMERRSRRGSRLHRRDLESTTAGRARRGPAAGAPARTAGPAGDHRPARAAASGLRQLPAVR